MSDGSPSCVDGKTTVYSCMEDLQLQLLIVFAAKQFAMKIVGIGAPLFKAAASEKAHQLQYKLLKDATKNKMEHAILDVPTPLHKSLCSILQTQLTIIR